MRTKLLNGCWKISSNDVIQWWSEAEHERLGENNTVGRGNSKKVKGKSCGRNVPYHNTERGIPSHSSI